jgi:hypothetical protein
MDGMVGEATRQVHDHRHPAAGPDLPSDAIGVGTPSQEVGQTRQRWGCQAAGSAGVRAMAEGFRPPIAGALHPLTDGPLAHPHRFGDVALGPACLLEVPGLQTSGFFPSIMCRVHAGQCITDRL